MYWRICLWSVNVALNKYCDVTPTCLTPELKHSVNFSSVFDHFKIGQCHCWSQTSRRSFLWLGELKKTETSHLQQAKRACKSLICMLYESWIFKKADPFWAHVAYIVISRTCVYVTQIKDLLRCLTDITYTALFDNIEVSYRRFFYHEVNILIEIQWTLTFFKRRKGEVREVVSELGIAGCLLHLAIREAGVKLMLVVKGRPDFNYLTVGWVEQTTYSILLFGNTEWIHGLRL